MTPEAWSGLAAIAAGLAAGVTGSWRVAGVVAEKLRARNGNGAAHAAPSNGGITAALARIEHEVSDRTGSVRTVKHDLAQPLQEIVLTLGSMREHYMRSEKHLEKIAETLTDMRVEAAERGNCCEHCGSR